MKITVGIVGWRRPNYFSKVLEGICNSKGYKDFDYVISLDNSDTAEQHIQELSRSPLSNLKPKVYFHSIRAGCAGNVGFTVKTCFNEDDVDACIILEDDIVPSHDFFDYMVKMLERFEDDPSVFTIGSYNRQEQVLDEEVSHIIKNDAFTCWGWGTWRRVFDEVKDNWFGIHWNGKDGKIDDHAPDGEKFLEYVHKHPTGSWAWPMKKFHRKGRFEIIPKVSRSQNIGREGGMFCPNAEWFDKNKQSTPVWMESNYKDLFVSNFNLIKQD